MSTEYLSNVLEDYKKKKEQDSLSYNMMALTPAKIKNECLIVFDKRFEKRDEKLVRLFFNEREESIELRQAIRRCEADRFRPLIKFLRGKSKTTDEKNIELLAWLIDFPDRPYKPEYEKMYDTSSMDDPAKLTILNEEEVAYKVVEAALPMQLLTDTGPVKDRSVNLYSEPSQDTTNIDHLEEVLTDKKIESKPLLTKQHYMLFAATIIIGFFLWTVNKTNNILLPVVSGNEECMYWAEDHYEKVSCKQQLSSVELQAFDHQKAVHLKKITQPDTITLKALGRVWYVKLDGRIEYYTAAGFHPIHRDLRLKPLTVYIYNKYLAHYTKGVQP